MAIDVVRDERRKWVLVRATGSVTLHEALTLIQTARADMEHRTWPMLVDARSATTDTTEQDVAKAVEAVQHAIELERSLRGHVAIVADDDRLYARTLLYEAQLADLGVRMIRVFRHLPDAERWLEIVSAARHFG